MRFFDVPEANRLVPYLDRTFREVRSLTERARELTDQMDLPGSPDETARLRSDREQLLSRIREELQRLEDMGLEVKAVDGLVDFRAIMGDRQVYLCWRFGEESVTHWHELETGISGRQPIDNVSVFEPSYLS